MDSKIPINISGNSEDLDAFMAIPGPSVASVLKPRWIVHTRGYDFGVAISDTCLVFLCPMYEDEWQPIEWIPPYLVVEAGKLYEKYEAEILASRNPQGLPVRYGLDDILMEDNPALRVVVAPEDEERVVSILARAGDAVKWTRPEESE